MIRQLNAKDIDTVQKLLSGVPEAAPWRDDDFRAASQGNLCLRVAEDRGTVCGVVVFRMVADEAEILNLAVDSRERRRGFGSCLIEEAIAACQAAGVRKIFLEVRESNEAARAFYARMRFTEAGRRREYYRHPVEDGLVLVHAVESAGKGLEA